MSFHDRCEAGRLLADRLIPCRRDESIVVAIPRGGIVVATEVARALNAEMDIVLVKKIGAPYNKDYAIGAISESGCEVIDYDAVRDLRVDAAYLERRRLLLSREMDIQRSGLRDGCPSVPLRGRTVIIVDDGVATGLTVKAAALTVRAERPGKMVLAVPVAASDSLTLLRPFFDE
ncbi:MAG: phosphoribosyltransferase family protein, partial [bacterium]|nr:phosphoribosyltransferase family protein [bacterium]